MPCFLSTQSCIRYKGIYCNNKWNKCHALQTFLKNGVTEKNVVTVHGFRWSIYFHEHYQGNASMMEEISAWRLRNGEAVGSANFLLTLLYTNLRWNELVLILSKLKGDMLMEDGISGWQYHERIKLVNKNPALVQDIYNLE